MARIWAWTKEAKSNSTNQPWGTSPMVRRRWHLLQQCWGKAWNQPSLRVDPPLERPQAGAAPQSISTIISISNGIYIFFNKIEECFNFFLTAKTVECWYENIGMCKSLLVFEDLEQRKATHFLQAFFQFWDHLVLKLVNTKLIRPISLVSFSSCYTWNGRLVQPITWDKNGSITAMTQTSEGSNPISSMASLRAVAESSTSPSSLFPPGNATSPKFKNGTSIHMQGW